MSDILETIQRRGRGTMLEALGYRVIEVNDEHAVAEITFRPELSQLTGLFHTGALLTLADSTATAACMHAVDPTGSVDPNRFPLAIQLSANLIRNTGQGTVTNLSATTINASNGTLTLAAGALLFVINELFHVGRRLNSPRWMAWGLLVGFLAGYGTDLFLTYAGG